MNFGVNNIHYKNIKNNATLTAFTKPKKKEEEK